MDVLNSSGSGSLYWLDDSLSGGVLISLSLEVYLNVLSLDGRLDILGVVVMSSRFLDSLSTCGGSVLSLPGYGRTGLGSVRHSLKLNSLIVVHNFSVVHRLSNVFFSWSVNSSSVPVGLGFGSSGDSRVVNSSGLSSVNVYNLLNGLDGRLDVLLSNSKLTRDIHIYGFHFSLVINNWVSSDSLSINWSLNNFSSLNRGLHNSLTDDRLRNNSLSDHWL